MSTQALRPRVVAAVAGLSVLAALCVVPLIASPFALRVGQSILFGAALAIAWNILGGFAGYWSFGTAAFLGLGAFTAALVQEHVPIAAPMLRFVTALAAGAGASALLAASIGYPILRLRGAYFSIAMLGVALVLGELSSSVDVFEGAVGITIGPVTTAAPPIFFFYVFLALAALALWITYLVRYARIGYGLIAIREDEDTARMLGVPTERYKLVGLVVSALLMGLVGAAYAFNLGYVTTSSVFRSELSFNVVVYALLGGMGTLVGPLLGALIMTLLNQVVLGGLLQLHLLVTGLIIIALVFLLPNGLAGLVRRRKKIGLSVGATREAAEDRTVAESSPPVSLAAAADGPLLRLSSLSRHFRGLTAIDQIDLAIPEGSIAAIIGPNGAGKSTLFNLVSGYLTPNGGAIWYQHERIDRLPTYRRSRHGIARVFQIARPFHGLSVYENVLVGALFGRAGRREPQRVTLDALALAQLSALADQPAVSLPVGHLRRLELARAMATRPRLVLADEPCAGLNPRETREMMAMIQAVRRSGVTVLLAEHDMEAVMKISDTVYVLAAGRLIAQGTPADIVRHPAVIEAYLGKRFESASMSQRAQ
jgi:branched-chain amino acid transport system permease protein